MEFCNMHNFHVLFVANQSGGTGNEILLWLSEKPYSSLTMSSAESLKTWAGHFFFSFFLQDLWCNWKNRSHIIVPIVIITAVTVSATTTWAPKTLALVGTSSQITTGDDFINYDATACYGSVASHSHWQGAQHIQTQWHSQPDFLIPPFGVFFLGPLLVPVSVSVRVQAMREKPHQSLTERI